MAIILILIDFSFVYLSVAHSVWYGDGIVGAGGVGKAVVGDDRVKLATAFIPVQRESMPALFNGTWKRSVFDCNSPLL